MWDDLELDNAEQIPTYKLILHCSQIIFAFVCWCLEIAVFRDPIANVDGRVGWTFAVVSFLHRPD